MVKTFIAVTFGSSQFPDRWSQEAIRDHEERTRKKNQAKAKGENLKATYPISKVRATVAAAYPLLAALRRNDLEPPVRRMAWSAPMARRRAVSIVEQISA